MEFSKIAEINKRLNTVDIKGKPYNTVNQRVLAFRELYQEGSIETDIVLLDNGICTIKAIVKDGDRVLATGLAQEKETSSFINKTSFVENCETSAVGRALGFLGIGITESIATAEEVQNAMLNQNAKTCKRCNKNISEEQYAKSLKKYKYGLCEDCQIKADEYYKNQTGWDVTNETTDKQE